MYVIFMLKCARVGLGPRLIFYLEKCGSQEVVVPQKELRPHIAIQEKRRYI